jgi:hypothetical protein
MARRTTLCVSVLGLLAGLLAPAIEARPVHVAWDPNAEAVAGYIVLRGSQPGVWTEQINVGNRTDWQFDDLTEGQTHYVSVRAYNSSGVQGPAASPIQVQLVGVMSIDLPAQGTGVVQPFVVAGWAVDLGGSAGSGVDYVHVYAFPNWGSGQAPIFLGEAETGGARPDVGSIFGGRYTQSGYALTVSGLAPGPYRIAIYARDMLTRRFNMSRMVDVEVRSHAAMALDTPGDGQTLQQPFYVSGWALDAGSATDSGIDAVHVYAFQDYGSGEAPVFLGGATMGVSRPDVAGLFGPQFSTSGFNLRVRGLRPGRHLLVTYAHSRLSGEWDSRAVNITVGPDQLMAVDTPGAEATVHGAFSVTGWAIDLGATSGVGVNMIHVWGYRVGSTGPPTFLGQAASFTNRFDVGEIFGTQFTRSGYRVNIPGNLALGEWDLVVYARSAVTGTFNNAKVVRISVQ